MSHLHRDQNRLSDAGNSDSDGECSNRVCNTPPTALDARLETLMAAWPLLPEAVRVAISAIVSATVPDEDGEHRG